MLKDTLNIKDRIVSEKVFSFINVEMRLSYKYCKHLVNRSNKHEVMKIKQTELNSLNLVKPKTINSIII